tara:strand:- start:1314 stop:1607 length:294 start_codon:yes stop_codon:yes gene_type:complete
MSLSVGTTFYTGDVEVIATSGRGLNPDELTRMLLPKLIYIGPDVPADVRAAAEEQMHRMEMLLKHYFAQAQRSQNTSIFNILMSAGHPEAAQIVKEL